MSKWEVVERLHCEAARCLPGQQTRKGKIMKYALLVHKSQEQFDRPDAQTLRLNP